MDKKYPPCTFPCCTSSTKSVWQIVHGEDSDISVMRLFAPYKSATEASYCILWLILSEESPEFGNLFDICDKVLPRVWLCVTYASLYVGHWVIRWWMYRRTCLSGDLGGAVISEHQEGRRRRQVTWFYAAFSFGAWPLFVLYAPSQTWARSGGDISQIISWDL